MSVRKGDWKLFTNAVSRSLDIFSAAGKPNYGRYGMLFFEDIMDLQRKFPDIYRHFNAGGFVCNMTQRSGSGIGFNQALEKCYCKSCRGNNWHNTSARVTDIVGSDKT